MAWFVLNHTVCEPWFTGEWTCHAALFQACGHQIKVRSSCLDVFCSWCQRMDNCLGYSDLLTKVQELERPWKFQWDFYAAGSPVRLTCLARVWYLTRGPKPSLQASGSFCSNADLPLHPAYDLTIQQPLCPSGIKWWKLRHQWECFDPGVTGTDAVKTHITLLNEHTQPHRMTTWISGRELDKIKTF